MFARYIMYLKNVIFFQFVICFFCFSLIIWIIQAFGTEYADSTVRVQNAEEALTEETLKLYSIVNSKEEILSIYKKYTDLSIPIYKNCLRYMELIPKIQNLSAKYKLKEPITVTIDEIFLKNNIKEFQQEQEKIRIDNYSVNLKFATLDIVTFLQLFQEIYSYMPPNTIVTFVRIRNEEVLTPKTIYKLSTAELPDFIYAKLTMYIRELVSHE
ncbi:hypothetical protein [Rickettsia endosymbiont of Halotydeus destructor]|uniref:hypothetical protein n=1 Tax=Rickettsia endosymbiont of Halotydeus destructor TaxID=2996754 RepID=UPI003BB15882